MLITILYTPQEKVIEQRETEGRKTEKYKKK